MIVVENKGKKWVVAYIIYLSGHIEPILQSSAEVKNLYTLVVALLLL